MKFYLNDYKGKWYVLGDEEDEMYGARGTIDESEIDLTFLVEHATMCSYYGIPMYSGNSVEFAERCDKVFDDCRAEEEKHYDRPRE